MMMCEDTGHWHIGAINQRVGRQRDNNVRRWGLLLKFGFFKMTTYLI